MARETWIGKEPGHSEEEGLRKEIARLRAEVARLTRELSDARAALLRGDRVTQDDMKWLLQERDTLRAQLEAVTRERDEAVLACNNLEGYLGEYAEKPEMWEKAWTELEALRACVTQLAVVLRDVEERCELGGLALEVRGALAAAEKFHA